MPKFFNFSGLPIPDTCKICGEPIAPDDNIISLLASTFFSSSPSQNSTSLAILFSKFIFLRVH